MEEMSKSTPSDAVNSDTQGQRERDESLESSTNLDFRGPRSILQRRWPPRESQMDAACNSFVETGPPVKPKPVNVSEKNGVGVVTPRWWKRYVVEMVYANGWHVSSSRGYGNIYDKTVY